jgi:hypothetical protein
VISAVNTAGWEVEGASNGKPGRNGSIGIFEYASRDRAVHFQTPMRPHLHTDFPSFHGILGVMAVEKVVAVPGGQ